jgi:hypothetical protein
VTAKSETSQASRGDSAERWFLRIDGHHYGPVGRTELERFLLPPRLCSVLEVKCGDDGVWFSIARNETIDKVLVRAGVAPEPAAQTLWQRPEPSALSNLISGLAAWLLERWVPVSAVVILATVNAVAMFVLRDPYVRDREILARYEGMWRELQAVDPQQTKGDDWRKLADPMLTELEPILKELDETASVYEPARQNLLFAGRDHLRSILREKAPPEAKNPHIQLFERRLKTARAQFPGVVEEQATSPLAKGAP